MELKNLQFKDFYFLNTYEFRLYTTIGLAINPQNEGMKDVMQWKFGLVKDIQLMFTREIGIEEIQTIVQKATGRDVGEYKWYDVFAIFNHIKKEIERIFELEKQLQVDYTAEQQAAGIEMYDQFGYFATVDRLCGSGVFTGMNYLQVLDVDYETVFLKMKLNKVDVKYQENYTKLVQRRTNY